MKIWTQGMQDFRVLRCSHASGQRNGKKEKVRRRCKDTKDATKATTHTTKPFFAQGGLKNVPNFRPMAVTQIPEVKMRFRCDLGFPKNPQRPNFLSCRCRCCDHLCHIALPETQYSIILCRMCKIRETRQENSILLGI